MIDYQAIADADPGGDLQVAFSQMESATVITKPPKLMSYITIANEVGFVVASILESVVNREISAGALPSWLRSALETDGVDINNPQTKPMLDTLVGGEFIQEMADAIAEAGKVEKPKFNGLTPETLSKARKLKLAGAA